MLSFLFVASASLARSSSRSAQVSSSFLVSVLVVMGSYGLGGYFGLDSLPFVLSIVWASAVLITSAQCAGRGPLELYLIALVAASSLCLLQASSLFWLVFSFELMTVSALILLRLSSKYDRGFEALVEMYLWAMIGSFSLIFSVVIAGDVNLAQSSTLSPIALALGLFGFMVKVPLWPFSSWLLKAHVEASTEFSIYLSGFLVKFGVIGLFKLIANAGQGPNAAMLSLGLLGSIDATLRLIAQIDLKRIIAALTIVETN